MADERAAGRTAALEREAVPLVHQVRQGAAWSVASVVLMRFANVVIMAAVARLVAPREFGVFALALTVHAVVLNLAELGVASAVARGDLDPDRIAPTAATISILSSLALSSLMAIFAHQLAASLGSPEAVAPLRVMALSVALVGPFAVPNAQLVRDFRQNRIFVATAVGFVPSSALLVILASHGEGAMAFAWSRVFGQVITGMVLVASVSKHYWPGFRRQEFGPLLRFGLPLASANLLSQLLLNIDYVFVGRMMGTVDVGLYLLAFNVASWPTALIGSMLNSVVMPAFSRIKKDLEVFSDALARASRTVALLAFPIGATLFVLAAPLIATLYGSDWTAAAAPLFVLSVYGILFAFSLLYANVIIALGRTGILLLVQVIALLLLLPAMAFGIREGGLVGVGLAHIVVIAIVILPVYLLAIKRLGGLSLRNVVSAIAYPAFAATLSATTAWAVALVPSTEALRLVMGGSVGVIVYVSLTAPLLIELLPPSIATRGAVARLVLWHCLWARRLRNWARREAGPTEYPVPRGQPNQHDASENGSSLGFAGQSGRK